MRPLCFVLMPFGAKRDPGGGPDIDFDAIYEQGIRPAVEAADMEPLRADQERTGGIIHKAMFERLLLCDFAVADVTTGNPNVLYELGVRHTARPLTTLVLYAAHQKLPFDLNYLRAPSYRLSEGNRFDDPAAARFRDTLTRRLGELRAEARQQAAPDSPLFQLLTEYKGPEIARLKTDTFRKQIQYSVHTKKALASARSRQDLAAVEAVEAIASYVAGFEADWRDAYPGINPVTLLDIKGDSESLGRRDELLLVVRFAVTQRLRLAKPDYWDRATLLELAGDETRLDWSLGR